MQNWFLRWKNSELIFEMSPCFLRWKIFHDCLFDYLSNKRLWLNFLSEKYFVAVFEVNKNCIIVFRCKKYFNLGQKYCLWSKYFMTNFWGKDRSRLIFCGEKNFMTIFWFEKIYNRFLRWKVFQYFFEMKNMSSLILLVKKIAYWILRK